MYSAASSQPSRRSHLRARPARSPRRPRTARGCPRRRAGTGSPPIPTIVEQPKPAWAISLRSGRSVCRAETTPTLPARRRRRDDPHVGLAGERIRGSWARSGGSLGSRARSCCRRAARRARDALGDRDHELDAGRGGLEDRIGREARRTKIIAVFGWPRPQPAPSCRTPDALDVLAALPGVTHRPRSCRSCGC